MISYELSLTSSARSFKLSELSSSSSDSNDSESESKSTSPKARVSKSALAHEPALVSSSSKAEDTLSRAKAVSFGRLRTFPGGGGRGERYRRSMWLT